MEPHFDQELFKQALADGNIVWRQHALGKMIVRDISRAEVLDVLEYGELIQSYAYDKPFPSALFLGFSESRPIHVVASFDESQQQVFVITVYEPDLTIFEPDFKTKRN